MSAEVLPGSLCPVSEKRSHFAMKLVPEVVGSNADGTLSVDYSKLTATLTSALQNALTRIEALEADVNALKGN